MPWNRFNPTYSVTRNVYRPGIAGQTAAGHDLTVADFTNLGLSQPAGLFNLASTTNLGTGSALTNKNAIAFTGTGIEGVANTAGLFTGSTTKGLYIADTGASDPFRIRTGSWGCWFKTSAPTNPLIYKYSAAARSYSISINSSGILNSDINFSTGNGLSLTCYGSQIVTDDLWHHGVATWDGSVLSVYLDGKLEGRRSVTGSVGGLLQAAANPVNIGSWGMDASNNAGAGFNGLIDEAFITADVLSEDQIRILYAAKLNHGLPTTPKTATTAIRRYRMGASLTTSDFSASPRRLYNFVNGGLTDSGLDNATLTNNNSAAVTSCADGTASGAYHFASASSQYLSATDTGLPSGTNNSTMGCWFKSNTGAAQHLLTYGTSVNRRTLYIASTGQLSTYDGGINLASPQSVAAGADWHFAAYVIDTTANDGYKQKLYLDGKLISSSTTQVVSTTLAGAAGFKIGSHPNGSQEFLNGSVDSVFVTDYAMTAEELFKIYSKGSQSLGVSVKNAGDHIERIDATSAYVIADNIGPQNQIDIDLRT